MKYIALWDDDSVIRNKDSKLLFDTVAEAEETAQRHLSEWASGDEDLSVTVMGVVSRLTVKQKIISTKSKEEAL